MRRFGRIDAEKLLNNPFNLSASRHFGTDHPGLSVVTTDGKKAMPEHERDFVRRRTGRGDPFTDKDRSRCPVRRRDIVVGERNGQNAFADFGIGETDPAGSARVFVNNDPASAESLQDHVALPEVIGELLEGQGSKLKKVIHETTRKPIAGFIDNSRPFN